MQCREDVVVSDEIAATVPCCAEESAGIQVLSVEQIPDARMKITVFPGSVFFIRTVYLETADPETIVAGSVFSGADADDIFSAGCAYAAECAAMRLLERCEQCRCGLQLKLQKKGFAADAVNRALDYLESCSFLSDMRFASAWLHNRIISVSESRFKLTAELQKRGISRIVAERAVSELLDEVPEEKLFFTALEKCRRLGLSAEKTFRRLLRCGFSYAYIQKRMETDSEFA